MNSALQRARAGMREHLPAQRQDWSGGEEDAGTRELVRRFTDASVATDIDGLAALLRDDQFPRIGLPERLPADDTK